MDPDLSQLDPEQLRRNLAITLGAQQPQLASLKAPAGPQMAAPGPITLPGQDRVPNLAIAPPAVKGPRGTLAADQAERSRRLETGPGVDQIYGKVTGSDFGQAHPAIGKILGGLGEGIAKAGDIGLSAIAPALAMSLPGTTLHHDIGMRGLNRQIGSEEGEQEREAQTAHAQAEVPLANAQTDEAQARADALRNPQPKEKEEQWTVTPEYTGPNGEPVEVEKNSGQLRIGAVPLGIKRATAKQEKPDTPEQQFIDEFQKSHPNGTVADAVHAYAAATQKPERGVTAIQQSAELDRASARYGKPHETSINQSSAQLEKIAEAKAMLNGSAEAQALGIPKVMTALVSGQGSGVRITQAELNMIAHARGIQGDFEGFVNKVSGKGQLTAEQKRQLTDVLDTAAARLQLKQQIANEALDKINGAASREEIIQADKEARQRLSQMENGGQGTAPQGATDEVYKDGKLIGHAVNGKFVPLGGK